MTSVVVSGYYGFGNFGDEAILQRILDVLGKLPGVDVAVITVNPQLTSERHGTASIPARPIWKRAKAIASADLLLFGGGSLIKDVSATGRGRAALSLLDVLLASLFGTKTFVYGVEVGAIRDPRARRDIGRILKTTEGVILRNSDSLNKLLRAGVPADLLHLGADPIMAMPPRRRARLCGDTRVGTLRIGVALAESYVNELPGSRREPFLDALSRSLISIFSGQPSVTLLLMAFQNSCWCRDEVVLDTMDARLEQHFNVERVDVSSMSVAEALDFTAGLDFLISMRLHGLILACMVGTPLLALQLDEKVGRFLGDMGLGDRVFDVRSELPERLESKVKNAWCMGVETKELLRHGAVSCRRRSYEMESRLKRTVESLPSGSQPSASLSSALLLSRSALAHLATKARLPFRASR